MPILYRVCVWLHLAKEVVAIKCFLGKRDLAEPMCCAWCHFDEDCFHLEMDCFKSRRVWKFLQGLIGSNIQVESMRG